MSFEPMWKQRVEAIAEWVERNGRVPGPRDQWGTWVTQARLRRDHLPAELVAALEAIPGWWWYAKPGTHAANTRDLADARIVNSYFDANGTIPRGRIPAARAAARLRSRYRSGDLLVAAANIVAALPEWDWGTQLSIVGGESAGGRQRPAGRHRRSS